jgi:hypothetical protein
VPGIRARVALALVVLVAITVTAIGLGVYAFVDTSLRERLIADARQQVDYNLSVLLPGANPRPTDKAAFEASGLPDAFALRGTARVLADYIRRAADLAVLTTSARRELAADRAHAVGRLADVPDDWELISTG